MQLKGKVVFITGGAGGIGSAFVRTMVQNGAQVCIADIDESKGEKMAVDLNAELGENKAIFVKCNVTNETSFRDAFGKAVETFSHVDVMVNNAGVLDEPSWERMLAINLNGTILGSNIALAHMRKDKGGRGGVITSPDINEQGVRFAVICPAKTDTPFSKNLKGNIREEYDDSSQVQDIMKNQNSARPETVAEGLLSLIANDDSNDTILQISFEDGLVRKKLTVEDA